jgi:hypothetical protein
MESTTLWTIQNVTVERLVGCGYCCDGVRLSAELRPLMGPVSIPHMTRVKMDQRWKVMTGESRRTRRNPCPNATHVTKSQIWADMDMNQGLRGGKPATNGLSHGTADLLLLVSKAQKTSPWLAPRKLLQGCDRCSCRNKPSLAWRNSSVALSFRDTETTPTGTRTQDIFLGVLTFLKYLPDFKK